MIDLYLDAFESTQGNILPNCVDLTDGDERVRDLSRSLIETRAKFEIEINSVKDENRAMKTALTESRSAITKAKEDLNVSQNLVKLNIKTIQSLERDVAALHAKQKELILQSDQYRKDSFIAGFVNVCSMSFKVCYL